MAKNQAPQPISADENGARPPTKSSVSAALGLAIDTLSTPKLREKILFLCHEFPVIIPRLEDDLLVRGKDIVRYHIDSDSEDNSNSEIESEESASDDGDSDASDQLDSGRANDKRKLRTAVGDDELTPRNAMCQNCEQEFDVTSNDRGDCIWHPGIKMVDYDSDFWADHDPDCHGPYESFEDDPDYAEGFTWDCCEKPGDDEGCKSTRHKAVANVVVPAKPPLEPPSNKKRKAEEESPRTSGKRGRH